MCFHASDYDRFDVCGVHRSPPWTSPGLGIKYFHPLFASFIIIYTLLRFCAAQQSVSLYSARAAAVGRW